MYIYCYINKSGERKTEKRAEQRERGKRGLRGRRGEDGGEKEGKRELWRRKDQQ